MGLLDKLRPQPKWKHPDAAVRLAGVQEIGEDAQDVLAEIARQDDDPRVRRAAVSKLGTVAVLADVLGGDGDPSVRDEAAGVLLDIALGSFEAPEEASLAALEGFGRLPAPAAQKQVVLVAKTARSVRVGLAAVDRLGGDQRALGTVARRAEREEIRREAFARLSDAGEIGATALKSEHKDVALEAVERVSDRAVLKAIAARAKNTAAARRAKAVVRAVEEQEAAAAAAEAARLEAAEARRREQRDLCRDVEALVGAHDWHDAAGRLSRAEAHWAALGDDVDPDLARRFGEAAAAARDAIARHEAERAAAEQSARERDERLAARRLVCERVEQLPIDGEPGALAALKAEWSALPAVDAPEGRALAQRFEAACRGVERRRREAAAVSERRARLEEICTRLEALVADAAFPAQREARQQWARLKQEWATAVTDASGDEAVQELSPRYTAADEQLKARDTEARDDRAREQRDLLARVERVARQLESLVAAETVTLKQANRALSDAITAEASLETVPEAEARAVHLPRLQAAREAFQPKAQALREADDWQRWANASVQEQLIAETEALLAEENAQSAQRRLREIQAKWKDVATAPRDRAEPLWRRFRTAMDGVRAKIQPHLAEQAAAQAQHKDQKVALCEQAEVLSESSDWLATADAIKQLQAQWKAVGPAPRKDEQALWERFRAACNRFFMRRQEDLRQRKEAWATNLARKEELCARAEALAQAADLEAAVPGIKALQAEWKSTGPVRKSKSEALWTRFRAACDRVFDRHKHRDHSDLGGRLAARQQLVVDLEALAAGFADPSAAPADLVDRVRSLRAGWQQSAALPRETLRPLQRRFDEALGAVIAAAPDRFRHTELDVDANRRQLEQLCERVERLAGGSAPAPREAVSPVAVLANQLKEALAANTIGGGRGDDEARGRSGEHEVRAAQDAWRRAGFVPESQLLPLTTRFQKACQRFYDSRRR